MAAELDLAPHVLRFWEAKFPELKPLRRSGGRRYYRPEDVALLRRIRHCLYEDGYTIRGVQQLLRERSDNPRTVASTPPLPLDLPAPPQSELPGPPRSEPPCEALRAALIELRRELLAIRELLRQQERR